jgi:nucleotide-binding universal stress UspA family protein
MSEKREEKVNPYIVLGVSDERANEMSAELQKLDSESQYTDEILTALAERYDCDSIVMGMYLGVLIMKHEGRLLPPNAHIMGMVALPPPDHDPIQN